MAVFVTVAAALISKGLIVVQGEPKVIVAKTDGTSLILDCPSSNFGAWYHTKSFDDDDDDASIRRLLTRSRRLVVNEIGLYKCVSPSLWKWRPGQDDRDWDYKIIPPDRAVTRRRRNGPASGCRIPTRTSYSYESITVRPGSGQNMTLLCGNSEIDQYTWYRVLYNLNGSSTLYPVKASSRVLTVDYNATVGHYECHYGTEKNQGIDRFYFVEEDKQPFVIQSNCTDNSRGVPCWYYSQKGDATKWSSYKCVYDLPPSIHCKTNKIAEPCVTRKETRFGFSYPLVKVPIRTWNDQPTTSFVCGLSKGNGRVLDENCWSVMLTVKYSQGINPTTSAPTSASISTNSKAPSPSTQSSTIFTPSLPATSSSNLAALIGGSIAAGSVVVVTIIVLSLCIRRRYLFVFRRRQSRQPITRDTDNCIEEISYRRTMNGVDVTPERRSRQLVSIEGVKIDKSCKIEKENVALFEVLGQGCFGLVWEGKAVDKDGEKRRVAVKVPKANDRKSMQDLATEVSVWTRIGKHRNVVSFIGICNFQTNEGRMLWVIMEHAEHGCLSDYLRAKRFGRDPTRQNSDTDVVNYVPPDEQSVLSSGDMFRYALDVARGMEHLALKGCVHRDLAARNVLVFHGEVLKVADFGMAKDIHYFNYYRKKTPGLVPYKWTAPESLLHRVFTEESDVWSYGILLWEIATLGSAPYPGIPVESLYELLVKDGYRMQKPRTCPHQLYDLMLSCWSLDPDERPRFYELVELVENGVKEVGR